MFQFDLGVFISPLEHTLGLTPTPSRFHGNTPKHRRGRGAGRCGVGTRRGGQHESRIPGMFGALPSTESSYPGDTTAGQGRAGQGRAGLELGSQGRIRKPLID